jgi:hypothetical protein
MADIAGAALSAVADGNDSGVDQMHLHPASDKNSSRYDGHHGQDDGDEIGHREGGHQLVPRLGHTKIESTVRYLGIEVDDAFAIAEQVDL